MTSWPEKLAADDNVQSINLKHAIGSIFHKLCKLMKIDYHILSNIVRTFYIENDTEIFPACYAWRKGLRCLL
jgi:hypothetical protein